MKHTRTALVIAAVLLALPFWGMLVVGYPLRWAFELLPGSPLINAIISPMSILGFFGLLALAHPVRYVVISLAARASSRISNRSMPAPGRSSFQAIILRCSRRPMVAGMLWSPGISTALRTWC